MKTQKQTQLVTCIGLTSRGTRCRKKATHGAFCSLHQDQAEDMGAPNGEPSLPAPVENALAAMAAIPAADWAAVMSIVDEVEAVRRRVEYAIDTDNRAALDALKSDPAVLRVFQRQDAIHGALQPLLLVSKQAEKAVWCAAMGKPWKALGKPYGVYKAETAPGTKDSEATRSQKVRTRKGYEAKGGVINHVMKSLQDAAGVQRRRPAAGSDPEAIGAPRLTIDSLADF